VLLGIGLVLWIITWYVRQKEQANR
jgi:hypothetical protein